MLKGEGEFDKGNKTRKKIQYDRRNINICVWRTERKKEKGEKW